MDLWNFVKRHWWKLLIIVVGVSAAYAIWQWIMAGKVVEDAEKKTSQDEVMSEDETV